MICFSVFFYYYSSTASYQEDYIVTVSAEQDDLPCSNEIEIKSCPPPKKIKTDQDEKMKRTFVLVNDKYTKPLPDPFPFLTTTVLK